MLKFLILLLLLSPMIAFADILPPEAEQCQTKQAGDACAYDEMKMGVCVEQEHCRAVNPSISDMSMECSTILVCQQNSATGGTTAGTAAGATAGTTANTTAGTAAGTTSIPTPDESDDSCASMSTRTELIGLISLVLGLILIVRTRKLS
jgi:hypothetical protein